MHKAGVTVTPKAVGRLLMRVGVWGARGDLGGS